MVSSGDSCVASYLAFTVGHKKLEQTDSLRHADAVGRESNGAGKNIDFLRPLLSWETRRMAKERARLERNGKSNTLSLHAGEPFPFPGGRFSQILVKTLCAESTANVSIFRADMKTEQQQFIFAWLDGTTAPASPSKHGRGWVASGNCLMNPSEDVLSGGMSF